MSTRPLNPRATIITFDGSSWQFATTKDVHIDIQFTPWKAPSGTATYTMQSEPANVVEGTAHVIEDRLLIEGPKEQEEGKK